MQLSLYFINSEGVINLSKVSYKLILIKQTRKFINCYSLNQLTDWYIKIIIEI